MIAAIKELAGYSEKAKEVCEREIGYFEKNKERMRYGEFKRRGYLSVPAYLRPDANLLSGRD